MNEVGEVQVEVWTSRPVTSIDLFDDFDGEPLVLGAIPANPVHVFEVTSDDIPGDGPHMIRAIAHAADSVSGEGKRPLYINVAPGGSDVWPPYVHKGPISGYTGAALLPDGSLAASGFLETDEGLEAVAVRIDGVTGQPSAPLVMLNKITQAGAGQGPAIAADDEGAVYVASTRPVSPMWAVSKVWLGEPLPVDWTWTGDLETKAHGIAVADGVVVLVGAVEISPGSHDLKVWWRRADDGDLLHEVTFAAPFAQNPTNTWDEIGRGVTIVDGEVIVVGERQLKDVDNDVIRRTVVLRYSLDGEALGEWTSPGELMEEDAGMAVAPLRAGGFVVTGWGRNKGISQRLLLTRWFSSSLEPGPVRVEPTTMESIGYAIGEDREGKIVIAGALKQPAIDFDAWVFAIPDPLEAHAWDVVRNGPGHGPDDAAGLALDSWGYVYAVGSEFDALQPRAYAMRLYP